MKYRIQIRNRIDTGVPSKTFCNCYYLLVATLLFIGDSTVYAQATGKPPLADTRIDRVEKPYTAAEAAILLPRDRGEAVLGVWSTCANAPRLCNAWLEFTDYPLRESSLPIRDRELLILRTGYLNQGAYERAAHRGLDLSAGIEEQELRDITIGSSADSWSDWDSALLKAAEELHEIAVVSDETWTTLTKRYDKPQMMEVVFTVGQYNLVAMYLNSLGVQFEEGWVGFSIDLI